MAVDRQSSKEGHAEIIYDGYDHQDLKVAAGTNSVLIRDRYFDGMTTSTPNATIKNEEGWRHIETDGKETLVRIDYP